MKLKWQELTWWDRAGWMLAIYCAIVGGYGSGLALLHIFQLQG